jgi:hypothetical protein
MMGVLFPPWMFRVFRIMFPFACAVFAPVCAWPWWRWEPPALCAGLAVFYAVTAVVSLVLPRAASRRAA